MRMRSGFCALAALACATCAPATRDPRIPEGYPDSYAATIDAAEREGVVEVWSTTDADQASALIEGFRRRYPRIAVRYSDIGATTIQRRTLARPRPAHPSADILWSSAMDLQIKLVNDGRVQPYESPERDAIPHWANWKNQAWGVTAEPIVIVYNRRLVDPRTAPRSHVDFRAALEAGTALKGRIATYDPARSAFGYLVLSQDDTASRDIWRLVRALGANRVRLFTTTEAIMEDVAAGRSAIGYNVLGSYAAEQARRNPDLVVVLPRDYTLMMSRIAAIPAGSSHPNAARLFLDYLLSREGQARLARHSMNSVRNDVVRPAWLAQQDVSFRAIRVGPALLVQQDALTRRSFMRRWDQAMRMGESVRPGELDP